MLGNINIEVSSWVYKNPGAKTFFYNIVELFSLLSWGLQQSATNFLQLKK